MADFIETVDKMFEADQRFGIPIVFAHFDRRALLSFTTGSRRKKAHRDKMSG